MFLRVVCVVQAPPYEAALSKATPYLQFDQTDDEMVGYNVASSRSWLFTTDVGKSLGVGSQTLCRTVTNSYGNNFDNVRDRSTTTSVRATSSPSAADLVVMYAMDYDVWIYPVCLVAVQGEPDGAFAVIFPATAQPVQTYAAASEPGLGYKPQHQNGLLLSYRGEQHDGFDASRLLSVLENIDVPQEQAAMISYNRDNQVAVNDTKSFQVHNSLTGSAHSTKGRTSAWRRRIQPRCSLLGRGCCFSCR